MNSWKEIGPLEVSASKSGAVEPKRKVVCSDILVNKNKGNFSRQRTSGFYLAESPLVTCHEPLSGAMGNLWHGVYLVGYQDNWSGKSVAFRLWVLSLESSSEALMAVELSGNCSEKSLHQCT